MQLSSFLNRNLFSINIYDRFLYQNVHKLHFVFSILHIFCKSCDIYQGDCSYALHYIGKTNDNAGIRYNEHNPNESLDEHLPK